MENQTNNAIVYSFYSREDSLDNLLCYKQTMYSIETLRKFNPNIPVKVFISPKGIYENTKEKINHNNIEIVEFDNIFPQDFYDTWLSLGYAEFLYHRWNNAFKAIELFNFDNILYLDGDTVFYDDPEKLFTKYGNCDNVWALPDNSEYLMGKIGISKAMNDGQFIISKNMIKHHKPIMFHIKKYVNETLKSTEEKLSKKEHRNLHWLLNQYAVYNYFNINNNQIKYFDENEIMLHNEPEYKNKDNLILQHYFTGNTEKWLPKKYWPNWFEIKPKI